MKSKKISFFVLLGFFALASCQKIDNPDPPILLPLTDRCIEGYFMANITGAGIPLCQQLLEYSVTPTIFQQVKYNSQYESSLAVRAASHLEDIFQQEYCQVFAPVQGGGVVTTDFHAMCALNGEFLVADENEGSLQIDSFQPDRVVGSYTGNMNNLDGTASYPNVKLDFSVPYVDIKELVGYEL